MVLWTAPDDPDLLKLYSFHNTSDAMKTLLTCLSLAVLTAVSARGQEAATQAEMPAGMKAVLAQAKAYEEAYAKGDVAALAAFFTEDAEYTSDAGVTYSGRPAIESCLRDAFRINKGAKLNIHVDSVKTLTPDVAVEKGSTVTLMKNGDEVEARYTAVHVKKDDKWKISQLIETPMPEITPAERLAELSWLVGSWQETDKEAGLSIRSNYEWARGGSFITRNVTVKRGDEPVMEGWQIIGWDPVEEGIRSWTFDDQGGYSEGRWTREGQRWLDRETGYAADGSRTSADNTLTKVKDDMFFWESGNRTLDGDPQPGIGRIEIKRAKGE
jgi:uncharacterized protein (TIGR02246 family)